MDSLLFAVETENQRCLASIAFAFIVDEKHPFVFTNGFRDKKILQGNHSW